MLIFEADTSNAEMLRSKFRQAGHQPLIACSVEHHRFSLSLRDVEELLRKRDVKVTYESVRNWRDWFGAKFARAKAVVRKAG